jgi:hypothetical protein
MAQKVKILITCDMDEEEVQAEETIRFGYDGKSYVFELCEKHKKAFEKAILPFVGHARDDEATPARPRRLRVVKSSDDLAAIRGWAKENGYRVSDRGRISAEVRQAFAVANSH